MTNQEIIKKYYSLETKYIYAFMYANKKHRYGSIIQIDKKELKISTSGDSFIYIWGFPGPDYNEYCFEDYGYTWAFDIKELQLFNYQTEEMTKAIKELDKLDLSYFIKRHRMKCNDLYELIYEVEEYYPEVFNEFDEHEVSKYLISRYDIRIDEVETINYWFGEGTCKKKNDFN